MIFITNFSRFAKGTLFALVASLFTVAGLAQDTSLTLQEAIRLGVENSKQLKAATARIDAAEGSVREALDRKLPDVKISGSYLRIANPTINVKNQKSGGTDTSGGTGLTQVNQAVYGIMNASLPIYAGGRLRYGVESARFLQEAAKADAENDKQAVILSIINSYVNLYKADATIDVVRENLQQSMHRDSVFSRLEQNGLLARNDMLKSQLQTSNIELALLDAENNRKVANVNLNLLLGLPEGRAITIDSGFVAAPTNYQTLEQYEAAALENRHDLKAIGYRGKAATTNVSAIRAEGLPSLALTGGYIAADIPHFISITNAVNIGIGLQYNLGSLWKSKAKIQQASARQRELMASEALLEDGIRLRINQEYENFLLAQKKIEVYRTAITQATENFRITKNKYDNNLVNTTDLLEADVSLLQANLNLAVAKADVVLAYNQLMAAAGLIDTQLPNNSLNQ